MAEFKILQFEDTPKGQQQKVAALSQWTQAGWKVVGETLTPGRYEGEKGCCLALICLPLAFLTPKTPGTITVTLQHD